MHPSLIIKAIILSRIEQLTDKEEKERVFRLYGILDRIEWLTIMAPLFLGMIAIIIELLVMIFLVSESTLKEIVIRFGGGHFFLCGIVSPIFLWIISALISKKIYCNPHRDNLIYELKKMAALDPNFTGTLQILEELAPDTVRNTRKFIPRTV